jgi:hypothetical protein
MTIEELAHEIDAIKARLDVVESGNAPKEGTIRTTPFGNLIFKDGMYVPIKKEKDAWTPPISNTIDQVPVVADIRAEKLAYIKLSNGNKLWVVVHITDNKTSYQEVVPAVTDSCGRMPAAGYFSMASSPKDLPDDTEFLRREWNAYYLEKFPPTKCHPVAGTWEMEPDED